jgi:purine nucleosidase/pyrimidine-specific ribonucleoside hydrolase
MAATAPCLLDCDPGHDDAIALLLAAAHPDLDLRAVTTVAGNGEIDQVTHNALAVCTLAGIRDVPIGRGAAGPRGATLEVAADIHGESALDGAVLPEPDVALDSRPGPQLIADTIAAAAEPLVLFATGPLTNVAEVLESVDHAGVREIVWMGGSTERGNRTPYAEFNAWADPQAAAAVLASGVRFTMVGLNLTHQALATAEVIARIEALSSELSGVVSAWLTFFGTTYRTRFGFAAPPVHDPCAVALVAAPGLVATVDAFVAIETEGRWTGGATVVDLDGRLGERPNARVATTLDVPRFWDLVLDAVARLGR